ncbi:TerD family protein [Methylovulum psychrotolerans]|uniref:Chemical-damaging agent resistance protein C n=1 Tax=Methylovulum psychrotolerans TaxID=1704499 RepID=A0A2S5CLX2_9GAMM|nr:TerD family protein [Methylovulum psychrotolerans]POZ51819.1 chemical-damaging agent resistance protein C [Methylovulum psychrotolerans]
MKNLQQGENISLSQAGITGSNLFSGISWITQSGQQVDIDVSAFLLNAEGKVSGDGDFIFYNQKEDASKSILLDTEPNNYNDVQLFSINLSKLPAYISKIVFVATIDNAVGEPKCFGGVGELCIRIFEPDAFNEKTIVYKPNQLNRETSVSLGELYLHQSTWKFRALGQGFESGLDALAQTYGVDLSCDTQPVGDRFVDQAMVENEIRINKQIGMFLPKIKNAVEQNLNESNTRMVLDRIFMEVLGYKMEEVRAEVKIQGRRADYVLSVDGKDVIVVEAKKAGMALKEEQIFQASSYGAYSGIKYVLLTNLVQFILFKVETHDIVEQELIFSIDVLDGFDSKNIKELALVSRYGMTRIGLLESYCDQVIATSPSNIGRLLLTGEILDKLKSIIKREQNIDVSQEQIQETIEFFLNI